MKILLLILICAFSAFGQTKATTEDGKKVILNPNGTWTYVAATQQTQTNGEPTATVYIYRLKEAGIYNRGRDIKLDGKKILELQQGEFFGVNLAPGKHSVQTNKDDSAITLDVEAGRRYFVYLQVGTGGLYQTHTFKEMTAEQAILEMKKTTFADEKQIKNPDVNFVKEKPY